ncbi:hypothetical protein IGI04_025872 [Brassica rapa subsp. trilocularis]|uniref:Uncharacterized protein n=1 Tax=Brassica rapa subsp. trilocularis TaxID=1813537 RepID=A0ABQ7KUB8_BRACM|nr:hypothetical protein IGI04_025872 [Brassica rapa subsp. trilocularis]
MVHRVIEANDSGWVTFVCDSVCLEKPYICSSDDLLGKSSSRLAVDDLPGSRLVNAEKFDFPRRLTFQSRLIIQSSTRRLTCKSSRIFFRDSGQTSRRLNFQSSEITDFKVNCKNNLCVDQTTYSLVSRHAIHKTDHKQNYYRSFLHKDKLGLHLIWKKTLSEDFQEVQTTFKKSRRLPGSSDDFVRRLLGSSDDFQTTLQEVQTTFRKSRRLLGSPDDFVRRLPRSPNDFQTTSR